jgi:hypothetical protein
MADEADADRIRNVSFALVPPRALGRGQPAPPATEPSAERVEILAALDFAARAVDHDTWVAAADRFLADLTTFESTRVEFMLRRLMAAQMSSAERGGVPN